MKRLPHALRNVAGMVAVSLGLGFACTGTIGNTGESGPDGGPKKTGETGGTGATGTGTGGGVGVGTGGAGNVGTGAAPGSAGTGGASTAGTGGSGGSGAAADPNAAGVKPARLLSAREYVNTVHDLLGDTTMQLSSLPPPDEDPLAAPSFAFGKPHPIATLDATLLQSAAESLAKAAVSHLTTLLPCAAPPAASAETTCLNTFMTSFMPKVFRRPLTSTETTHLMSLYTTGRNQLALGFNDTIGFVLEASLQSPGFLYHWEQDPGPALKDGTTGAVQLGGYELANRLSYFLWGTMPDATLFTAASGGQLKDAASVEAQVRRMLMDPKATGTFVAFFTDWLDIPSVTSMPKDGKVYPMFNDALATTMVSEVGSFVSGIMAGTGSRKFSDLMTGTNSYANQALANLYGISGVTGTALTPVMLNATQRKGLLTTAAFLASTGDAAESNPPRRGKAIYTKVLCGVMPPPPANVPPPAPASQGGTLRQRMEEHDKNACASGCHGLIEPFGFAFEEYGGIGEYRTTDNNAPVDSTGSVKLDGQVHTYANAPDLVALLAASPQVQSCFSTQWLRYAFGRGETPADQASLSDATRKFTTAGGDLRELVVGLATSRTFRYRTPAPGEVLP